MLHKLPQILAVAATLSLAGSAYAANPYSAQMTPAAKSTKATKTTLRSPASIQCSKEADQRNLHGKVRKQFRASCKTALKAHKPIPEPHKT